jgi:RNA polymerase sigma-70 factor, ECF subfamily
MAVARRLPDYLARRPMPFHLWVRKTAYERMLNERGRHLSGCRDARKDRAADAGPGRDPSPSAVAVANEMADRVAAVVAELPEKYREILMLHQAEGLSYAEVAVILSITPAAARQRYVRALLRLEAELSARGLMGNAR